MILGRLPLLLVLALVVSGSAPSAGAVASAVPGHERAWELITPADPVAAIVLRPLAQSPDGASVAYMSIGPLPGAGAGDLAAPNRTTRGPAGWTSEPLGLPYEVEGEGGPLPTFPVAFSRDLATSIWSSRFRLTSDGPEERYGLYRREPTGRLTFLVALGTEEPRFVRIAEDASRVVFSTPEHLLPADASRESGESLYEVEGTELRLVDVDATGALLSACGASVSTESSVSRLAERIFFTTSGPDCAGPQRVYMREGGTSTLEISSSQCTRPDCNAQASVSLVGATRTGSSAFLVGSQQLTDEDSDEVADLYRYDAESGELELLSGTESVSAGVLTERFAWSSDGSRVYFFARGRLVPGQGAEAETNLYVSDRGELRFLASLPETKLHASASGENVLLETSTPLDGADTDGRADVYRYDAGSNTFARISSGPLGGNGDFNAVLGSESENSVAAASIPLAMHQLSAGGAHAFFVTSERLVPEDTNEFADVYEWSAGNVALVSSGSAGDGAQFAGASGDGRTAFFLTSASLVAADRDGGDHDLYAARIGGGFEEQVTPGGCGECRAATGAGTVTLPALASTSPTKAGRRGRLRVVRIGARAGRNVARKGATSIVVFAPAAGLVRVTASDLAARKAERSAAAGRAGAVRPGRVTVPLSFVPSVRRRLQRGVDVPVRLVLRLGSERAVERVRLDAEGRR